MGASHWLNVRLSGPPGAPPMLFAHGFGCDQTMWRFVAPEFEVDFTVVLFDVIGCGRSDSSRYDPDEYNSLDRYAADVLAIVEELDLRDVVVVGHSVSAMIGALATIAAPDRFAGLVMVSPSPRYIDDAGYLGGFTRADVDELLDSLDSNYLGWSAAMAPVIMSNSDHPELSDELASSFRRVDPTIAREFARVTFLGDNRADLPRISVPTLVLQCEYDAIAPKPVGIFVHEQIAGSELKILDVAGHCPNLSAPALTASAIRAFVTGLQLRA